MEQTTRDRSTCFLHKCFLSLSSKVGYVRFLYILRICSDWHEFEKYQNNESDNVIICIFMSIIWIMQISKYFSPKVPPTSYSFTNSIMTLANFSTNILSEYFWFSFDQASLWSWVHNMCFPDPLKNQPWEILSQSAVASPAPLPKISMNYDHTIRPLIQVSAIAATRH